MAPSARTIEEFVSVKTLAVVGASATGKGFGAFAYQELKKRGYQPRAVHPTATTIAGDRCWPSLAQLPEPPERVLVVVKPEHAETVVREAATAGCRAVWLQQGAETPAALAAAAELGVSVVHGQCILMFAEPVGSFHAFHKWLWKVLGKMPA
jgi:uncharacterized protein